MANAEHGGGAGGAFGAGAAGTAQARLRLARVALWLVVAVLAVRQVAVVLGTPKADRLTDLETWVGPDGVLHVNGSLYDSTQFTGTPFGGLVLKPLTRAAEQALGWGWTFGTLLLVVALGVVAARALPAPVSRRTSLLAAPVAISLLMLSLPVRNTLYLGQTSIIPVLLVLLGCFVAREERAAGALIGLAAALQPTVLLFAPLLWFTGRRRAAVSAGITFVACTALAWAAMADDSYTYWVHHLGGAGLGGAADDLANQSLHGALLRLGVEGPSKSPCSWCSARPSPSSACAGRCATPRTANCCWRSPSRGVRPSPFPPRPGSTSCCGCSSPSSAASAGAPPTATCGRSP